MSAKDVMEDHISVAHIDPDLDFLESTKRYLEGVGNCTVSSFISLDDALESLTRESVDVIVSELDENLGTAVSFLRKTRSDGYVIPYILFTSKHGEATSLRRVLKDGADFLVEKGGDPESQLISLQNKIRYSYLRRKAESTVSRQIGAIEASVDGIALLDGRDGMEVFTYANKAFLGIFGYERDELMGASWPLLFSENEIHRFVEEVQPSLYKKGCYRDHAEGIRKDGTTISLDASMTMLEGGGLIIIARDVTSLRSAEENMNRISNNMRNLLDSIEEMIFIMDEDCNIINSNRTALEKLGYSKEELRSMNMMDLQIPGKRDDAMRVLSSIRKGFNGICDIPLVSKSGEVITSETNIAQGLWNSEEALIGVSRDISHRLRIENDLRESELFNRTLMEKVPAYILLYGDDMIIRYINRNASSQLGVDPEDLIGRNILTVVDIDYKDDVKQRSLSRSKGVDVPSYETVLTVKDGRKKTVMVTGERFVYKGAPATLVVLSDITEMRRAEAALFQANKKLQLLSSITRHDVLNHLTALQGFMELASKSTDRKAIDRYMDKMSQASMMIQRNIEFTREYEKLGLGEPEWQDIKAILDEVDTGGLKLDVRFEGLSIMADSMLSKVFHNLMDNTRRHGEKVTRVSVSAEPSEKGCCIVWEDDGVGVPEDQKERIFERGVGKHTGLGLFLTREILSITGISIKEEGTPGNGARFRICVPEGMWRMNGPLAGGTASKG